MHTEIKDKNCCEAFSRTKSSKLRNKSDKLNKSPTNHKSLFKSTVNKSINDRSTNDRAASDRKTKLSSDQSIRGLLTTSLKCNVIKFLKATDKLDNRFENFDNCKSTRSNLINSSTRSISELTDLNFSNSSQTTSSNLSSTNRTLNSDKHLDLSVDLPTGSTENLDKHLTEHLNKNLNENLNVDKLNCSITKSTKLCSTSLLKLTSSPLNTKHCNLSIQNKSSFKLCATTKSRSCAIDDLSFHSIMDFSSFNYHSSFNFFNFICFVFKSLFKSTIKFTRNYQSLIVPLLLVLCTVNFTDACSARSTPKPRPPLPEIRPNITFQTYQCPEAYAKWYCLNGATCFFVRIGESILYNCECADGYMGQRCEFKDLEGSYLQSREKVLVETAKVAGGTFTLVMLIAFIAIIFFANYKKRKSSRTIDVHTDQFPFIT